jgi:hypothetical protein
MEICHHWKNERADAVVSGHNNEIAARSSADRSFVGHCPAGFATLSRFHC